MLKSGSVYSKGFTIVELLVVIVVIGILAAITIIAFNGVQARANEASLQSDLRGAINQIEAISINTGAFPVLDATASTLSKNPNTTYQYTGTAAAYCITATSTKTNKTYYISNVTGGVKDGLCAGHSASGVALTCPVNYIVVPGNSTFSTTDFCAMKYEAKNVSGVATSTAAGTSWDSITQANAVTASQASCSGCHLITENEWLTIAHNVLNVASNWSGGAVGSGYIYSGHNDNSPANQVAASTNDSDGYNGTGNVSGNQRRTLTLSNGQVIWDFAGNAWEWTTGTITSNFPGAAGWNYREWNTLSNQGALDPKIIPSYGTPAASGWTSAQGIGQLYSRTDTSGTKAFTRGAGFGDTAGAGIFSLNLSAVLAASGGGLGFRVTK